MNPLKARVLRGEKLVGTIVSLLDSANVEIFGTLGYDFVWIDMEHTAIGYPEALSHMNACRASGTSALVRVPQNDLTATKKILDMGPEGIVFPMVRSAEEFRSLMEMTLYPPLGTRGFGPMRAIDYGAADVKHYVTEGQLDMCRLVQIEHISMIDELEEIAQHPYIDGFLFGPNDLSGSVGDFLNVFGKATMDQIARATEIVRRHGKWLGLAGGFDEQTLRSWSALDLDLLFSGGDWNFIYGQGKETLERMRAIRSGK
jgi:2-dehydro-3-deoxyglucarate aldolase/4-hydroxy-2-oxoheptanedioate aldolase